jgi:4-hydroxy-tetrahydrodipicolinate synthase
MGLSGYHLPQTCRWIGTLCQRPLAGLLLPPPHYIRPSQVGLLQWFTSLADVSSVPVIAYDIPGRTGVTIERQTLLELGHHPRIRAVKDCGGDAAKTLAVIAQGQLQVLAGEDLQMFATVAQGGVGAIAASAHVGTARFVRMLALLRAGDLPAARAVWRDLVPWIELAFSEPNPAVIKAALAHGGELHNELRAPMQQATPPQGQPFHALCPAMG